MRSKPSPGQLVLDFSEALAPGDAVSWVHPRTGTAHEGIYEGIEQGWLVLRRQVEPVEVEIGVMRDFEEQGMWVRRQVPKKAWTKGGTESQQFGPRSVWPEVKRIAERESGNEERAVSQGSGVVSVAGGSGRDAAA